MTDHLHLRTLTQKLRELAEPVAASFECEVVAIELLGSPTGNRVLRISLEKPGGAGILECTRVSKGLSPLLDEADLIDGAYDLEVSTPGFERPLQREADFAYFAGCEARIKLFGGDARRRLKVHLLGAADGVVRTRLESGEEQNVLLSDIERANLVLTLPQYARIGQGLHPIAEGETQ
jgi:ribosome maturation factor RimP